MCVCVCACAYMRAFTASPDFPQGNYPTCNLNTQGKDASNLASYKGGSVTQVWLITAFFPLRY